VPDDKSFDPNRLRLSQDFDKLAGVQKLLTVVPVRRPDPLQFIRVHPDPDTRLEPVGLLELTFEQETYLVAPEVCSVVGNEIRVKALFLAITRDGVPFLWPVGLPGPDGRTNPWSQSAMDAARRAMVQWIRVRSDMERPCQASWFAKSARSFRDRPVRFPTRGSGGGRDANRDG
jgi:hypothetical protein